MKSAEELRALTEDIAERVCQRLQSARWPGSFPAAGPESALGARAEPPPSSADLGPIPLERIRSPKDLAPYVDHTLLQPGATREEVVQAAREGRQYGFAAVCVHSANVEWVAEALAGSSTVPIAVVGFPLGASLPEAKAFEARSAIQRGAREVDTVVNLGALREGDYRRVLEDVKQVVGACRPFPVKVILETHLLSLEQKIAGAALAQAAGAAFVKTCTGFSGGGATVEDVSLLRKVVGTRMGVKASGGIRSAEDALKMIGAGANRIGTSASVSIVSARAMGAGD